MKLAWLITGIVISILTIVFATPIYDCIYANFVCEYIFITPDDSGATLLNDMYNTNMHLWVSIINTLVSWAMAAVFYYLIDSVRFCRWWSWLLMLLATLLVAPNIDLIVANNLLMGEEYGWDFLDILFCLSWVNPFCCTLMFIVASFSMRWWSVNCRHTPIPE